MTVLVPVGEVATHKAGETSRYRKAEPDRPGHPWLVVGPLIRFKDPFPIFYCYGVAVV